MLNNFGTMFAHDVMQIVGVLSLQLNNYKEHPEVLDHPILITFLNDYELENEGVLGYTYYIKRGYKIIVTIDKSHKFANLEFTPIINQTSVDDEKIVIKLSNDDGSLIYLGSDRTDLTDLMDRLSCFFLNGITKCVLNHHEKPTPEDISEMLDCFSNNKYCPINAVRELFSHFADDETQLQLLTIYHSD